MKKILLSLIMLVPVFAMAQTLVADKVVAVVGNSAILYSDLYDTRAQIIETNKQQGISPDKDLYLEALENLLLQKLLYQQALVDSLDINNTAIDRTVNDRVNALVTQAGSTTALEKSYGLPLYSIKEIMKTQYVEMSLAQQMQQSIRSSVNITPLEVERFYKKMDENALPIVPEQYVYAQITMSPLSLEEAKVRVREQLLEMRKRIIDGTRFDLLARMYSVDGSARKGGEMDPTPKEGFVAPFADALSKLTVGQVSEVVETEFGYHLIELLAKQGNLYTCRHILLRPVFSSEELSQTDKLLDSVLVEVKAGGLSFEQAALEYSDDKYSKTNGGVVSNLEMIEMYGAYDPSLATTRFLKDELQPMDYHIIKDLKPGDVSSSFQTEDMRGNVRSKAIKLLQVIPSHKANIDEDYLTIKSLALTTKQNQHVDKWIEDKINMTYIRIDESFRDANFENKAWLKKVQ